MTGQTMLSAIKRFIGQESGANEIQKKIDALQTEIDVIKKELDGIPARRNQALLSVNFVEAVAEINAREQELYVTIDRNTALIAELNDQLLAQYEQRHQERIEFHRRALLKSQQDLDTALCNAIEKNEACVTAWREASAELGGQLVERLFARVHFAGILRKDSVNRWRKAFAPRNNQPASGPGLRRQDITGRVSLLDYGYSKPLAIPEEKAPPVAVEPAPSPKPVFKRELPEKVPEGYLRVVMLRPGFQAPDGHGVMPGTMVDLPRDQALTMAKNGAVNIVETNKGSS